MKLKYYHYVVHGTLPANKDKGRTYARNARFGVVCESVLRSCEIVKSHHPDFEINGVNHGGEIDYLDGIAGLIAIPVSN